MSDTSRSRSVINFILVLLALGGLAGCFLFVRMEGERSLAQIGETLNEMKEQNLISERLIAELQKAAADREAEFATRSEELRQREAAIAGREDAASERTQSSFQGLLIQQQLTKNLEALKASLPDLTPEVEKLAREHAQLGAERQRLEKENADLRRQLGQPASPSVP